MRGVRFPKLCVWALRSFWIRRCHWVAPDVSKRLMASILKGQGVPEESTLEDEGATFPQDFGDHSLTASYPRWPKSWMCYCFWDLTLRTIDSSSLRLRHAAVVSVCRQSHRSLHISCSSSSVVCGTKFCVQRLREPNRCRFPWDNEISAWN